MSMCNALLRLTYILPNDLLFMRFLNYDLICIKKHSDYYILGHVLHVYYMSDTHVIHVWWGFFV